MKKIIVLTIISATLIAAGCGGGAKDKKGDLGDMKVELEKLKKDKSKIDADIRALEEKIGKLDSNAVKTAKLVSVDTLRIDTFAHYIDLQSKIDADNIVFVTPRGMPAQVKQLNVREGDRVSKGQLLAKLDDAVMQQQLDGLNVQLAYAQNIYNRQKSLWDQGIGTEVQLITAKNNVDALNKQIASFTETWKTSFVYAPISGTVDELNIKEGEIFTGVNQIKIVNGSSMKVVTEVPDNYVASVRKGGKVEVAVPETGKPPYKSVISLVSVSIDPKTRSFTTEAKLPADPLLKPNQNAMMKILDYEAKSTIVVPINVVQTDEKGKYVYVMEKSNDKWVARKKAVIAGEAYDGRMEIKSGLKAGDIIITEGYQTVYDGQTITTK